MKVIINADDFGASVKVNQAIENCIINGDITSTTIMAGGKAFDDAVSKTCQYPQISFGVHLALDEFASITRSMVLEKYGLIDENGIFIKDAYKGIAIYTDELLEAIYSEWTAQIKKVRDAGVNISHVDSHHHCHTLPQLKKVLHKVMIDNNLHRVRIQHLKSFDMYMKHISGVATTGNYKKEDANGKKRSIFEMLKFFLRAQLWQESTKKEFLTTDFFCPYSFFFKNHSYLERSMNKKVLELMCHPGHPNYEEETNKLSEFPLDIEKISYNDLI